MREHVTRPERAFVDKPFRVGDAISVDGMTGTVENVGLKTTQVRSLSGEMLVFANSDLTKARINFRHKDERAGPPPGPRKNFQFRKR